MLVLARKHMCQEKVAEICARKQTPAASGTRQVDFQILATAFTMQNSAAHLARIENPELFSGHTLRPRGQ